MNVKETGTASLSRSSSTESLSKLLLSNPNAFQFHEGLNCNISTIPSKKRYGKIQSFENEQLRNPKTDSNIKLKQVEIKKERHRVRSREYRKLKKIEMENMEKTVKQLESENSALQIENIRLNAQLTTLLLQKTPPNQPGQ